MKFRLYCNGDVWFRTPAVSETFRFAHVVDLHLPPRPIEETPTKYHHAIEWWEIDCDHPHEALGQVLDEVQKQGVDFVFFGGDVLDCFHEKTATGVVEQCARRNLPCYFQRGNHDHESLHVRYVTHENDAKSRRNVAALCKTWRKPGLNYAFMHKNVKFVALDCPFRRLDGTPVGILADDQLDWLVGELAHDGPIVVFHHVPLNIPTLEHRLRAVWKGELATLADDANTRRFRDVITAHGNILGTFVGHAHLRSEDPLGGGPWQFMTGPGCERQWRCVCISPEEAPKSMRVPGEPVVPAEG